MLYRKTKTHLMETDFFDIVPGGFQGNTLASCLFIICPEYVLRTSIDLLSDNSLKQKKTRSRRYVAETLTDADYTDEITRLENTPAQAESQLHDPEQTAGGIGPYVNSDKTEYM